MSNWTSSSPSKTQATGITGGYDAEFKGDGYLLDSSGDYGSSGDSGTQVLNLPSGATGHVFDGVRVFFRPRNSANEGYASISAIRLQLRDGTTHDVATNLAWSLPANGENRNFTHEGYLVDAYEVDYSFSGSIKTPELDVTPHIVALPSHDHNL